MNSINKFPAGEVYEKGCTALYYPSIRSSDELMQLALRADILRAAGHSTALELGYCPYGRQDRRDPGEALGVKVFADFLNYVVRPEKITIHCPHSDVFPALLNMPVKIVNFKASDFISYDGFIFPDAGAAKRFAYLAGDKPVIVGNKKRVNGTVVGLELFGDYNSCKNLVVVDDICDGGATFIATAKAMADYTGKLTLHVYHGLFTKGKEELLKYYNSVLSVL